MKRAFSVSLPRSGHHALEMVLKALLGGRFCYCEFYTVPGCCRQIPCTRSGEFAEAGAALFLQKSHDHALADRAEAGFDAIIVQVREPVARALSNYELDLQALKLEHGASYQVFWLGLEAAYTLGFVGKWCDPGPPGRTVLRYEELLADPAGYVRRVFHALGLDMARFDAAVIAETVQTRAGRGGSAFRAREIRGSRHFSEPRLAAFQALLDPVLQGLDYRPHALAPADDGTALAMRLVFEAKRAIFARRFAEALDLLERYLALPGADPSGWLLRQAAWNAAGEFDRGEAEAMRFLESRPGDARGHTHLIRSRLLRQDMQGALAAAEAGLRQAAAPEVVRNWLLRQAPPGPLRDLAGPDPRPRELAREEVVQAFRLVLGREPESELVILEHRRAGGTAQLREALLTSAEFRAKHAAAQQADPPPETPSLERAPTEADVAGGFRWLLGREVESEATMAAHLRHPTLGRLRLALLRAPELRTKLAALGRRG